MQSIAEGLPLTTQVSPQVLPRFADGTINMQELLRQLAESITNEVMSEEADELLGEGNYRNGYRDRQLMTCVGTLNLKIPKLRHGTYFPEDILVRYQRADRALVATVAEMYEKGVSTRKAEKVVQKMGLDHLSKDQVSRIVRDLDADVEELLGRDLSGVKMPYLWLDATYVKCRQDGRVVSLAIVTAIGCDWLGYRHVLGVDVVDTESYDSWIRFLRRLKARGINGVELVISDAHEGLKRAIAETFQGASWQRCVVHLMRDCMREASSKATRKRVGKILSCVFRAKDADTVRAMYRLAEEMLEKTCPKAAHILEEAEPDALAYLDFPEEHWKRIRTNNLEERTNREIKRRTRVVQVFPSKESLIRLVGSVMADEDELWQDRRYFSEHKMAKLYEKREPRKLPTKEQKEALMLKAKRTIEASLELAEEMEAA